MADYPNYPSSYELNYPDPCDEANNSCDTLCGNTYQYFGPNAYFCNSTFTQGSSVVAGSVSAGTTIGAETAVVIAGKSYVPTLLVQQIGPPVMVLATPVTPVQ